MATGVGVGVGMGVGAAVRRPRVSGWALTSGAACVGGAGVANGGRRAIVGFGTAVP